MKWGYLILLISAIFIVSSCAKPPAELPPPASTEEAKPEVSTSAETLGEITRSGHITQDETWSGIVHVTGDVFVDAGVTLTILQGTRVLFGAHSDDQHSGVAVPLDEWITQHDDPTWTLEYAQSHTKLDVYGTLIARGAPENMIIFTSDSQTPDGGDWSHLYIGGHGSTVEYCIIEYSRGGVGIATGSGDIVIVSNNTMRHNLWTAICIHSCSPTLTYNDISHSGGHQGIDIIGEGSAPLVANNVIKHCKAGIIVHPGSSPVIEDNALIDNDLGIVINPNSSPVIRRNSISSPNGAPHDWTYQGKPVYFAFCPRGQYSWTDGIRVLSSCPTITNNKISNCPKNITIVGNSSPTVSNNTITGGENGILFEPSFTGSPKIYGNNIYNNSANIGLMSANSIDASNNWWGTTDISAIEARIHDSADDPSLGTVFYEPFLTQPVEMEY